MSGRFDRISVPSLLSATLFSDFLIIGAGVAGLSTALELAARGAKVVVLERGSAGRESTWAGAGILSPLLPWDYGDAVNALSEYSRSLFPAWCDSLQALSAIDPEFRETGMLVMPPFDLTRAEDWCRRHGWRHARRNSKDFLPVGAMDDALWLPDVAQARNPRLAKALRGAAAAMGVELRENVQVSGLESRGGRVRQVLARNERFSADAFVVAAGAWSGDIPGLEGFSQRIYPVRGQILLFKQATGCLSTVIYSNGHYMVPRADGHILVGSTLEYVGFNKSTTDIARREILDFAVSMLPALAHTELVSHWSGLRPGSPDNLPVIGRHPVYENLFLNSGHFRYGVTMAPGSAKLLTSLVLSEPPPIPPAAYIADGLPSED